MDEQDLKKFSRSCREFIKDAARIPCPESFDVIDMVPVIKCLGDRLVVSDMETPWSQTTGLYEILKAFADFIETYQKAEDVVRNEELIEALRSRGISSVLSNCAIATDTLVADVKTAKDMLQLTNGDDVILRACDEVIDICQPHEITERADQAISRYDTESPDSDTIDYDEPHNSTCVGKEQVELGWSSGINLGGSEDSKESEVPSISNAYDENRISRLNHTEFYSCATQLKQKYEEHFQDRKKLPWLLGLSTNGFSRSK